MTVTDGHLSAVCRFSSSDPETASSLYINEGRQYLCENGVCRMRNSGDPSRRSVVVSSEPLSEDGSWTPVAPNTILTIDSNLKVSARPITF